MRIGSLDGSRRSPRVGALTVGFLVTLVLALMGLAQEQPTVPHAGAPSAAPLPAGQVPHEGNGVVPPAPGPGEVPPPEPKAAEPGPFAVEQGGQGLQGGWAVDERGNIAFLHSLSSQYPLMRQAGAGWVRINFRLGACFPDWTSVGCNGKTALQVYDEVVTGAVRADLQVLGLLSNESWHGAQPWTANNAERTGGSGDNAYLRDFAQHAAGVLAAHFRGRIREWEVWNEPNCCGSFMYPSNFAWLLTHSYAAIKAADPAALVISGGLISAYPEEPLFSPCASALPSGATYLCATYDMGMTNAGWVPGAFPLDHVGQHLYLDASGATSGAEVRAYVEDMRNAYLSYEGADTGKQTYITELGWTTARVTPAVQAANLQTAYTTLRQMSFVARTFWFSIQDIPEADLAFGLVDAAGAPKPGFLAYQTYATAARTLAP